MQHSINFSQNSYQIPSKFPHAHFEANETRHLRLEGGFLADGGFLDLWFLLPIVIAISACGSTGSIVRNLVASYDYATTIVTDSYLSSPFFSKIHFILQDTFHPTGCHMRYHTNFANDILP
jgi:hypothetical protein